MSAQPFDVPRWIGLIAWLAWIVFQRVRAQRFTPLASGSAWPTFGIAHQSMHMLPPQIPKAC